MINKIAIIFTLVMLLITTMPCTASDNGFGLLITAENFSSSVPRIDATLGGHFKIYYNTTEPETGSIPGKGILRREGNGSAPATVSFSVPENDQYRIFVHLKEYTPTPSRIAKITIDDKEFTGCHFGTRGVLEGGIEETLNPLPGGVTLSSGLFYWDGGENHHSPVYLEKGRHTLKLSAPISNSVTRVDAILILKESDKANFPVPLAPAANYLKFMDTQPPVLNNGLQADSFTPNSINLNWNITEDSGNAEIGLYRNRRIVATPTSFQGSYTDTGLSPNSLYHYTLRAVDAMGQYAESTPILTTLPIPDRLTPSKTVFDESVLLPGSDITLSTTVTNSYAEQKNAYLIGVLTDNEGQIVNKIKSTGQNLPPGATVPLSVNIDVPEIAKGLNLKSYLWTDLDTLTPIVSTTKLSSNTGNKIFGMATSGETIGNHAKLYPLLNNAGVSMIRAWPAWESIQPQRGVWNWTTCDNILKSARANNLEVTGFLAYIPGWASSINSERGFPIADIEDYRTYVRTMLTRYKDDVRYWEVYNEFNSTAFSKNSMISDYVEMTREAYTIAREIDPGIKIGIGCADADISFLYNVLKEGAAGHIDFVAVHPYSVLRTTMEGQSEPFLRLGANMREMLVAAGESADVPLWITEIGIATPANDTAREKYQEEGLIKSFILPLAQDFEKVYWFEGKGPDYGNGDFGIIRPDAGWTKRPSYYALQTMTGLLGETPRNLGWTDPTGKTFCFVFEGRNQPVMAAWSIADDDTLTFPEPVTVTELNGNSQVTASVTVTQRPVFITGLPQSIIDNAKSNYGKSFPWIKDVSEAESVYCVLGESNINYGMEQIARGDEKVTTGLVDGMFAKRTSNYMHFMVSDTFAGFADNCLEITVTARQYSSVGIASVDLYYESIDGYKLAGQRKTPSFGNWREYVFTLDDASFANNWSWNFRLDVQGGELWIQKVEIKKYK